MVRSISIERKVVQKSDVNPSVEGLQCCGEVVTRPRRRSSSKGDRYARGCGVVCCGGCDMAQMIIEVVLLIKRCSRYCVNGEPSKKYERMILLISTAHL